jgi:hypothetical protein
MYVAWGVWLFSNPASLFCALALFFLFFLPEYSVFRRRVYGVSLMAQAALIPREAFEVSLMPQPALVPREGCLKLLVYCCSLFGNTDLHFFAHTQTYLSLLIHIHTYTLAFVSLIHMYTMTHPHLNLSAHTHAHI